MIRVFNTYIPAGKVVLVGGEIAAICVSFLLPILLRFGPQTTQVISEEHALWKIAAIVLMALLLSHFMEFYDLRSLAEPREVYARVLVLVGSLSFILGGFAYLFPTLLQERDLFLFGLCILAGAWMLWRWAYGHLMFHPALRERVFLMGNGDRAKAIAETIRNRAELGMDIVEWADEAGSNRMNAEAIGSTLRDLRSKGTIDRVIVALKDRRSVMPVDELLQLRLDGVRIDDGTNLIEQVSGRIDVDELHPSWMIFGDGFHFRPRHWLGRRIVSVMLALTLLLLVLPVLPVIALLIALGSKGPVLYRQRRVGQRGKVFDCLKFRTMRADAEAKGGAQWAKAADPRITGIGKFLRRTRLDELPQLWNVLCGDMAFVGPRPERPEFVTQLAEQIPYYQIRHVARPGITGWAQVNYGYGSSVEESKEKLRYDLYYIRNVSVMLDLVIVFRTLRTVLIGRGVR